MNAIARSALMAAELSAAASLRDRARRIGVVSGSVVVAGTLIAAAVGCAAASLWIYAAPRLGPAAAPLLVAGVLLVMALAVLMLTSQDWGRRRMPPPSSAMPLMALADATRLIRGHKGIVLTAALVAGLIAGSDKG
jgi:hypothetical protein